MLGNSPTCALLLILLGIPAGCKTEKTLSADDLRSELKSISSVASEIQLFATQIREQRVTRTFAREHVKYLRDQNEETLQKLANASATGQNDAVLQQARIEAAELSRQLTEFSPSGLDPSAESVSRIDQILSDTKRLRASVR